MNFAFSEWKKDVLESAADRFERRLTEETGKLRVDMARMETRLIAWMFVFWLGQIGAIVAVAAIARIEISASAVYFSTARFSAFHNRCGRSGDGVAFSTRMLVAMRTCGRAEENRRQVLQVDLLRVDERLQPLDAIERGGIFQHQLVDLALPVRRRRRARGIPHVRGARAQPEIEVHRRIGVAHLDAIVHRVVVALLPPRRERLGAQAA